MRTTFERFLTLTVTGLLGLIPLGCGVDVEGEPAPSCITDPQLCPAMDGGVPPTAVLLDAPDGFGDGAPGAQPPPVVDDCPVGLIPCNGICVDPEVDPDHCGGCGLTCRADQQCRFGQCCELDDAICDGVCTDTQSDELNCGSCGFVCDFGLECVLGVCTPEDPVGP